MRILFVCLGNICRSPAAEGVMRKLLEEAGVTGVEVDSAGIISMHEGKRADLRMRRAAAARGVELVGRARPVRVSDLREFDLVVAMDRSNLAALRGLEGAAEHGHKLRALCGWCREHEDEEVPDPYYGGAEGFERVLDLLFDGCAGLLDEVAGRLPDQGR
jgi:protein-tyrosine phosphatase